MGKPAICIGENKGANQLRSNCEADQRLSRFSLYREYHEFLYFLNLKFPASNYFCDCTIRFVLDLVGTKIDEFSHAQAYFVRLHMGVYAIDPRI